MTDDFITLDVTWEDMGNVVLLCSDSLLRNTYNCQSYKAFSKISTKDSGRLFK